MPALPGISRLQPGQASFGRRASAADFGAAQGAATEQRARLLPELAEASEKLLVAREGARADRALSEAALEVEQQIQALGEDPDESTHEERFEKAAAEIRGRYSKPLFGMWQGDFAERFDELHTRAALRVRDGVRARRVSAGRADKEAALQNWANAFARADEGERGEIMAEAAEAIGRAQGAGLFSAEQAHDALRRFEATATGGLWRRLKNDDPEQAMELLRERAGGLERMDEAQRAVAIEEVENEIAQRARFAKAEEAAAKAAEKEARREREEQVTNQGMGLLLDGKLTVDWIRQNRESLSRTEIDYFLDQTKAKAGAKGAIPDPAEWQRLVELQHTDPAAFLEEKPDPAKLGPVEWRKMVEAQAKVRKGGSSAPSDIRTVSRQRARLRTGLSDEQVFELQRSFEAALEDFETTKGGKSTPKERQSVLDAVELERYREGGWFSRDSLAAPGTPIEIPGVDQEDVQEAVRALELAGERVTAESITAKLEEMAQ